MKILLLVLSPFIATGALAQAGPPADSNVRPPAAAHATAAVTPEEWLRRAGTEPDLEKAEALLRAARIQHPADGSLKVALGKFLAQTKHDLNEAEKLIRSAYSAEADNPDRLQAYGNFLWKMQGDAKSAEPLLRSVLAIRERQFWKTHPAVLASLLDLALALDTCGKFVEAQHV
jgi:tetratricopeptide (TPR) repeat protein